MQTNPARAALIRELRKVLPNLYSPGQVRQSWLIQLFDLTRRRDAPAVLQHLLSDAIQAIEPGEDCPVGSNAWRVYHVLHSRYIDQFSQDEVARDIFLSPRQLRRLELTAVEVLADHLWAVHSLEERIGQFAHLATEMPDSPPAREKTGSQPVESEESSAEISQAGQLESGPSGHDEELSWLERTVSNQQVDCIEFIQSALNTAQPLLDSLGASVSLQAQDNLPGLSLHPTSARQALLHVITLAARQASDGQVTIHAEITPRRLSIDLHIRAKTTGQSAPGAQNDTEGLEVAQKLIQISKGSLTIGADSSFLVTINLPTTEHLAVVVIDDNLDTLRLIEHYLAGTRYRFIGISHPTEMIETVAASAPGAILLDVMLPEIDGWELLGRLRMHPNLQHTPMIVYTILPQSELALMLGADDFLRKPIRREVLLSTLDRLVGLARQESA